MTNMDIARLLIPRNQIGDEGAMILAPAIMRSKTLAVLDLTSNELSAVGGKAIIEALGYNESIIDINFSSPEGLHRNTLGVNGVKPLEKILAYNKFITILNLSGNFIGNKGL